MNYYKRGEIATVVALATLLVVGISSFITSNVLKQKFPFSPRAEENDCTRYITNVTVDGVKDGDAVNKTTFNCDITTTNIQGQRTDKDNTCGIKINGQWPVWCKWDGILQNLNRPDIVSRGVCNIPDLKPGDKLETVAARAIGTCSTIDWNKQGGFVKGPTFYYQKVGSGTGNTPATTATSNTNWDWDMAAKDCPKDAGCICGKLKSGGFCSTIGATKPDGSICETNKWDPSWGCWRQSSTGGTSVAASNSCSSVKSKYGTCPDWATENSCHQRLLAGDPDDTKWFKCVNKLWNGPCDTKDACEGSVPTPTVSATSSLGNSSGDSSVPVGPVDRSGLSSCYNYTSKTNCIANCQLYAKDRKEPDFDKWYCNKNLKGDANESGQYCCPPNLNPNQTTGTYAKEGETCYSGKSCEPNKGLVCGNITGTGTFMSGTCIKSSDALTPTAPLPSPTGGISSTGIRNKCFAETAPIEVSGISFTEPKPGTIVECGDDVLLGKQGDVSVYRACAGDKPEDQNLPCLYSCYNKDYQVNCSNVYDQKDGHIVRILNSSTKSVYLSNVLIKKEVIFDIYAPKKSIPLSDFELVPGTTYVINFRDDDKVSCNVIFPTVQVSATLFYKHTLQDPVNTTLQSNKDWCAFGVRLLMEIK